LEAASDYYALTLVQARGYHQRGCAGNCPLAGRGVRGRRASRRNLPHGKRLRAHRTPTGAGAVRKDRSQVVDQRSAVAEETK
jgi:hypothetical protein